MIINNLCQLLQHVDLTELVWCIIMIDAKRISIVTQIEP